MHRLVNLPTVGVVTLLFWATVMLLVVPLDRGGSPRGYWAADRNGVVVGTDEKKDKADRPRPTPPPLTGDSPATDRAAAAIFGGLPKDLLPDVAQQHRPDKPKVKPTVRPTARPSVPVSNGGGNPPATPPRHTHRPAPTGGTTAPTPAPTGCG